MNPGKLVLNMIIKRSFRTKPKFKKRANPGVQLRLNILENDGENEKASPENFELDDVEPDFMQAHQSYDSHQREIFKEKELLKRRIVARKYFNENSPSLLTFIEKEQIRHLNNSDPVEYSPEKLSESFPALPHTIRKILKANWTLKTADKVIKHDQLVIDNWKKYNLGEMMIEPRLREHLEKFKHRKISLPNREEIEKKFIPPPRVFPEPKSQLYSGIIKSYLEQKKDDDYETSVSDSKLVVNNQRSDENNLTRSRTSSDKNELILSDKMPKRLRSEGARGKTGRLTLDEFFKSSVKEMDEIRSMEDKVLLDTYQQKIESDTKIVNDKLLRDRQLSLKSDELSSVSIDVDKNLKNVQVIDNSKDTGLATYVKSWEKKSTEEEHYPQFINIPKNKYQKGKSYQLRDCYYDHDGEFLYRVPGLKE